MTFGALPGVHKKLVNDLIARVGAAGAAIDPDNPTHDKLEAAEKVISEEVQSSLLVSGADKCRFGLLKKDLANDYLMGQDHYPPTMDKAVNLLGNYVLPQTYTKPPHRDEGGVAFLQQGGGCGG